MKHLVDYQGAKALYDLITEETDLKVNNATTDLQTEINAKQNTLVSGTNIKSINSTSVLGSGNMNIDAISVLTTAPTSANTGLTKVVHLATNPATKYDGYIYLIDEE